VFNMKPRALIIEDNRNMAHAFEEALIQAGYEPELVFDGAEALSKVLLNKYGIVLLDVHLPYITGDVLLERIRKSIHSDTNVILVTADSAKAEELREDADLVLLKPIGFTQLRDIASRMLRII
jgi:DNA-binding response OmpR family regulator